MALPNRTHRSGHSAWRAGALRGAAHSITPAQLAELRYRMAAVGWAVMLLPLHDRQWEHLSYELVWYHRWYLRLQHCPP